MLIAHPIQESNKKYIRVLLPDMAPRPTWYYSPNTDHRDTSALVHSKDRWLQRSRLLAKTEEVRSYVAAEKKGALYHNQYVEDTEQEVSLQHKR